MKSTLNRTMALGAFCAILASAGAVAGAQTDEYHRMHRDQGRMDQGWQGRDAGQFDMRRARRQIALLQATYDHEIRSGHPAAAMRAHMRAEAIRARIHEHRREWF